MDLGGTQREKEGAWGNCIGSELRPVGRLTGDNKGDEATSAASFKSTSSCSCTFLESVRFVRLKMLEITPSLHTQRTFWMGRTRTCLPLRDAVHPRLRCQLCFVAA